MKAKRYLAILLAIAMVFGAVSMASAASVAGAQFSDINDASQKDSISLLGALGVVQGHGGTNNYAPADNLTRAEFAVMMSRLVNQEDAAKVMAALGSNFTDADAIADWALGYINFAAANGWLKGFPDGSVQATGTLTLPQAVTVVLRVLGYGNTVPDSAYPAGHLAKGAQLGLTRGVPIGGTETPITRDDMARIVANALFVPQMGDDGKVGDTLVARQVIKGSVVAANSTQVTINVQDPADNGEDQTTRKFADSVTIVGGASSLSGLVGLNVEAFTADAADEGEKVFLVRVLTGSVDGIQGVFEKFVKDDSGDNVVYFLELADGTKVEYDTSTQVSVNGTDLVADPANSDNKLIKGDDVQIVTAGGKAKTVYATRWTKGMTNGVVTDVYVRAKAGESSYIEITVFDPATGNHNEYEVKVDGSTAISLNGEAAAIGDLKDDDVVNVALKGEFNNPDDGTAVKIQVTRNVLNGIVTERRTSGADHKAKLTIRLADGTTKTLDAIFEDAHLTTPGQHVKLLLNAKGEAVDNTAVSLTGSYAKLTGVGHRVADGVNVLYAIFDLHGEEVTFNVNTVAADGNVPAEADLRDALNMVGEIDVLTNGRLADFTAYAPIEYVEGQVTSAGDALLIKVISEEKDNPAFDDGLPEGPGNEKTLPVAEYGSIFATHEQAAFYNEKDVAKKNVGTALNASNFSRNEKVWIVYSGNNVVSVLKKAKADSTTPDADDPSAPAGPVTLNGTTFPKGHKGSIRVSFVPEDVDADSAGRHEVVARINRGTANGSLVDDVITSYTIGVGAGEIAANEIVRVNFLPGVLEHLDAGTYVVTVEIQGSLKGEYQIKFTVK